ncbi:MAG: CHRD domain-containing protein [Betaproteobacteria bacterium]|nr:CHRD domain-containing protein [Betaproteobacteria bacterium]
MADSTSNSIRRHHVNTFKTVLSLKHISAVALTLISLAVFAPAAFGEETKVTLSGDQEVPPVKTAASGSGSITVDADMSVSGGIATTGVAGTMAHIHQGAVGANGPVVIPFVKNGDNGWSVPPGTKMTEAQYQAFKAGQLYINVHSAENKGGEIRAQIKP